MKFSKCERKGNFKGVNRCVKQDIHNT